MNGSTFRLLTMPSCRLRVTPSSFFLSRNLRPPTRLKPHLQNKFFTSSRSRATSSEDSLGNALLLDELKAEAQRPISLRPLLVGAGICAVFFFVAEVLDGKHDAKFFATIRRLGWAHDGDLNRLKRLVATAQRNQTLAWLDQADAPIVVKKSYSTVKSWWMKQESGALDGKHATLVLIAANTAVFLAWNLASRYPRLLSRMKKSFSHFPGQTGSYTLLTSVFSHRQFWHFSLNMLGLYSFGPDCFNYLQSSRIMRYPDIDEKGSSMNINSTYHHIAFFITCGVVANLIPHYISLLAIRSPMLMNSSAAPALIPRPGLGASGAIWSCLAVSGLYDPSTQIVLVFLPMFPFSIGYGLSGMALFDAIGVFRGWQMFGHMQHLTGAAAGVGAYFYGPAAWYWAQWSLRGGKISS